MGIEVEFNYETPRVYYGDMCFVRLCPECARFVKADETLNYKHNKWTEEDKFDEPNATCKKHGRVNMIFEGYF